MPISKALLIKYLSNYSVTQLTQAVDAVFNPAAVLIPIIEQPSGLTVLFTERTQNLGMHPGQICFPGGKKDSLDKDLQTTALRETHEEIGIASSQINIIATLVDEISSSGFRVTPFCGLLTPPLIYKLNDHEVAAVFEIPLEFLLNKQNYYTKTIKVNNQTKPIYFIKYHQKTIWGLTAKILMNLVKAVTKNK